MAEVVAAALLPEAGRRAWEFVQEMAELSSCMKANYLCLEARMKTLCAHKDDMKERTTKYKSTEDRTMNDWFNKVDDAEKRAHELEKSFRKKQKGSKLISARSRDGPILQSALSEIQQDLKAIRVQGRKLHMYHRHNHNPTTKTTIVRPPSELPRVVRRRDFVWVFFSVSCDFRLPGTTPPSSEGSPHVPESDPSCIVATATVGCQICRHHQLNQSQPRETLSTATLNHLVQCSPNNGLDDKRDKVKGSR
ncbi:Disease resistance protein [Artemisia annua]|uniref:Disease resistance protein n=1 Tax=Artemisia annua TaxID=35608 RepID=A0A2U1Q618_ARTAN|nr:Disease resistance protein [Artemisia annua]